MSKGSLSLDVLLGFSDELQKIASLPKPTSLGDTRKTVSYAGTALAKRKPSYAKVHKDPVPPASISDLAESSKAIQPPPVTMPGQTQ